MKKIIEMLLITIMSIVFLISIIGMLSVRYVLVNTRNLTETDDSMTVIKASDKTILKASIKINDNTENHNWVILVHSYRTNHYFMNPYAKKYEEKGYNIIQPDNRAHGVSEGKYIGMGYLDQYDILSWIQYILDLDSEASIVLHGVSMGGAALMMLSSQPDLPKNVKCIIEDSGFSSATEYLTWKLKQRFYLPEFPIIPIANIAFKVFAGYYLDDASCIKAVQYSTLPILFIHGADDQTVPVEDVYKLYKQANCKKELYIVKDAGHGAAIDLDQEKYWNKVFSFINQFEE